ncbi:MAG: HEAT repeat domain-containing protein [Candidatus Thiodiazotropha endolucinida]|nr:HEAT repeat domain-containing protein [Candidatus Thiodiazotropha taylori]MCW4316703.1 HEAT repeat domain-containing protein [Candidatus Thiodiazotropha taylori]
MDVSVIVRFKNEAEYLEAVLRAVQSQRIAGDFEIVAVDNESTDQSPVIAQRYADRFIQLDTYRPGRALNQAIEQACGKYIAVLSAHTIPANSNWLHTLMTHMQTPGLAGVYGGQLYNSNSKFLDKRDLDIFSCLEPRVETTDTDFWNANSMFPRVVWESMPFDETVFELEDHYWTKLLTRQGYVIHFEPEALVYHYAHIDRIDREFLSPSFLSEEQRITAATEALNNPNADWPKVMRAGLELSSLTHNSDIFHALPALTQCLGSHWDFDVRWRMAQALGKIPHEESVKALISALSDDSFYPRDEAAWSLARIGTLATGALERAIPSLSVDSRPFAALALGLSGTSGGEDLALELLKEELFSCCPQRERDAVYVLGELAQLDIRPLFTPQIDRLFEGSNELVQVVCWALGCMAVKGMESHLLSRLQQLSAVHEDQLVRFEATVALGKYALCFEDEDVIASIVAAANDPESRVRYGAAQSLRLIVENGGKVPYLIHDLDSESDFGVHYEFELIEKYKI